MKRYGFRVALVGLRMAVTPHARSLPSRRRRHWHRGVLTDFLDAIEHDRPPRVSGAEALKVHRFIDALLQSPRSAG